MSLIEQLTTTLREKNLILATAESCTAGMIAAAITDVSGASDVFDRGFVTYSNQSKRDMLGVSVDVLNTFGAVSAQCAGAMVLGALENCAAANIAVSVTGIAGPNGGTPEKPVGLVYIGVCIRGKEPMIEECFFNGSRAAIRKSTVEKALELLIEAALTV
ncbi:MAG: CinA family protein [Alphaproteobacteria bacterium]